MAENFQKLAGSSDFADMFRPFGKQFLRIGIEGPCGSGKTAILREMGRMVATERWNFIENPLLAFNVENAPFDLERIQRTLQTYDDVFRDPVSTMQLVELSFSGLSIFGPKAPAYLEVGEWKGLQTQYDRLLSPKMWDGLVCLRPSLEICRKRKCQLLGTSDTGSGDDVTDDDQYESTIQIPILWIVEKQGEYSVPEKATKILRWVQEGRQSMRMVR